MFGENMKRIRESKGLPAKYIAHKCGVEHRTVNKWERGTHYPTLNHLYTICELLECTPNDLLIDAKESDQE